MINSKGDFQFRTLSRDFAEKNVNFISSSDFTLLEAYSNCKLIYYSNVTNMN